MNELNKKIKEKIKSAVDSFIIQDYEQAVKELKSAEMLDKENPEILYNLGIAYSRMGLFNTAIEYFLKLLSSGFSFIDSLSVRKLISFCYINMEKYSNALKYLETVLSVSESDTQALNMKGYCLDKTGQNNESLTVYKKIFKYDKSNLNSINAAAYILARQGTDLEQALKMAKFAVQQAPDNPSYMDTLGYIYLKSGNLDKAEELLRKAEKTIPFNDEIKEHIATLERLKNE